MAGTAYYSNSSNMKALLKYLLFVLLPMTSLAQTNVVWLPGSTVDNTVVARNNFFVNGSSSLGGVLDTTGSVSGLPIGAVRVRPQDSLAYVFNGRATGRKWAIIGTAGTAGVASLNVNGGGPQTGALSITIPTNTNQLTNGAGFITTATANVRSVNGLTGIVVLDGSETKVAGDGVNINGTGAGTTVAPYLLTWIGKRVDSIWRTPGKDSIQFSVEGRYHAIKDSVGAGGGSGITALTGDGAASGTGSVVFTLATVNTGPGSFGSASSVPVLTINGKGLVTVSSSTSIQIAESQVTNLLSDLAAKQPQLSGTGYTKFSGTTPSFLTPTQVTADLNLFTTSLQGLVPSSGGGTTNFLRADGTWAPPPGGGGSQTLQQVFTTGSILNTTNTITNTGQTLNFTGGTFKFNGLLNAPGAVTFMVHGTDSALYEMNAAQLAALLPTNNIYVKRGLGSSNDSTFVLGSGLAFDSTVVLNLGLAQQLKFDSIGGGMIFNKVPVANATSSLLGRRPDSSLAQIGVGSGLTLSPTGVLSATGGGGGVALDAAQTITSGTTATVTSANNVVQFNPASAITTFSLTAPATPHNGDYLSILFGGTVTSGIVVRTLTFLANSGQTVNDNAAAGLGMWGQPWIYKFYNNVWYRQGPQPGLASLSVVAFGAVGDSVTDNTAAFRACAAECSRTYATMLIPPGNWVISDSIIIGKRMYVKGSGGLIVSNDEVGLYGTVPAKWAATNVIQRGANKSGFVIDPVDTGINAKFNPGSGLMDFNIVYQNVTKPTSNAGVRVVDGGSYIMNGVSISGFYVDNDVLASSYPSIVSCQFSNPARSGMRIQNTVTQDNGGTMITNTSFISGRYKKGYSGVEWNGSGAFRISNCEFNTSGIDSTMPDYCMVLNNFNTTVPTQEIYINNISLSGFNIAGLRADSLLSLSKDIIISNIVAYGSLVDSLTMPAVIVGTPTGGHLSNVIVSNITATGYVARKTVLAPIPVLFMKNINGFQVSNIVPGTYYGFDVGFFGVQGGGMAYSVPITFTELDANGIPTIARFQSIKDVVIGASDTATNAYANGSITFKNGTVAGAGGSNITGGIDRFGRWTIGAGIPITNAGINVPMLTVEKDTNAIIGILISNSNAGSNSGGSIGVSNLNTSYGSLSAWGSGRTVVKNLQPSAVNIYSLTGLNILADDFSSTGAGISIGGSSATTGGNQFYIASASTGYMGVNIGRSPTAGLDIAGSSAGYLGLRVRSGSLPTTPLDGLVYNDATAHHLYVYLNGTAYQLDQQAGGGATLTYTQLALNNTLSISGGNTQTFLTATSSLSGLLDTARARAIDSLINRQYANLGVTSIGTFSNTPVTNGFTIVSNALIAHLSDATHEGLIGLTAQTMGAGVKTFGSDVIINGHRMGTGGGTGNYAISIGNLALGATNTGDGNIGMGVNSLHANTSGADNLSFGTGAMFTNTTGTGNVAIGTNALTLSNSNGNVGVGYGALQLGNNSGGGQTAVGANAVHANTSGTGQTGVGSSALLANTTGNYNTAIGGTSLSTATNTDGSTAIGFQALKTNNGAFNTVVGMNAAFSATTVDHSILMGAYCDFPSNTASAQLNFGNVLYGLGLYATNSLSSTPTAGGKIGIGLTTPTARLHLAGGTATAGTASFKITAGTVLTTTEAGAIENDGTHLYYTATNGGTRFQIDQQSGSGLTSANNGLTVVSSVAKLGGSLTANTSIDGSASNFSLNLGNGGNPFSGVNIIANNGVNLTANTGSVGLFGNLILKSLSSSNANLDLTTIYGVGVELVTISANRTVTLPSPTTNTQYYDLFNTNTAAFTWTFASTVKDLLGNTITTIPSGSHMHLYSNGTVWYALNTSLGGRAAGSFSQVGAATTVFTVTIGKTEADATYKVNVTPTAALSAALFYVTNKTATTFDVTYLAGLTGTVTFDWTVTP